MDEPTRGRSATALVVENDPTADVRRLGEWLTGAGLALQVVRPYAGEPLPTELTRGSGSGDSASGGSGSGGSASGGGFAALVVLGGEQRAYPDRDGTPGAPWFPALESLLRKASRAELPTLGICLGAQLLAQAHGGLVEPSPAGPEIGLELVAKRDAAERDPLFGPLPMLPDVMQWHRDEVTELPAGAVLLAASTYHPHQAFRVGRAAWGVQFHIECDTAMVADWASTGGAELAELGIEPEDLIGRAEALMDDLFEVWQPFAVRFARLARGELELPDRAVAGSLPITRL